MADLADAMTEEILPADADGWYSISELMRKHGRSESWVKRRLAEFTEEGRLEAGRKYVVRNGRRHCVARCFRLTD